MFWWLWRLLFDPSGAASATAVDPPTIGATLAFRYQVGETLDFPFPGTTIDFDYVRGTSLNFGTD